MNFDLNYAIDILPRLLFAARITLFITFAAMGTALVVGLVLAIARASAVRPISWAANGIFQFLRGTPILIQLFFLFYVLPIYGLLLPAILTGIVGLGIHIGAFLSEVYRSGIQAVPVGQWEAATALNLPRRRTWLGIILPQAIRPMIPAFGSYAILMFKESAIVSTITVQELLGRALTEAHHSYRFLEPILLVGLIYFLFSYPASRFVRRLEARYAA